MTTRRRGKEYRFVYCSGTQTKAFCMTICRNKKITPTGDGYSVNKNGVYLCFIALGL